MSGLDILLERVIDATPEAVFRHWVDPDARRGWYAPESGWLIEAETDLRVGGAWSVSYGPTPDQMYRDEGVFEVVDPPHRLVYNLAHALPGPGATPDRHDRDLRSNAGWQDAADPA